MARSSVVSARRVAGVLGGLGVGAAGGFVASLLRRRPATIYTERLQTAEPSDVSRNDATASGLPEAPGPVRARS